MALKPWYVLRQGDEAWIQYRDTLDVIEPLSHGLEATYQEADAAKDALQNCKDELFLSLTAEGLLDGKNADMREAQLRVQLHKDRGYLEAAMRLQQAEDEDRRTKREWEIVTIKLQAYRYLVGLRTAQINAVSGSGANGGKD